MTLSQLQISRNFFETIATYAPLAAQISAHLNGNFTRIICLYRLTTICRRSSFCSLSSWFSFVRKTTLRPSSSMRIFFRRLDSFAAWGFKGRGWRFIQGFRGGGDNFQSRRACYKKYVAYSYILLLSKCDKLRERQGRFDKIGEKLLKDLMKTHERVPRNFTTSPKTYAQLHTLLATSSASGVLDLTPQNLLKITYKSCETINVLRLQKPLTTAVLS